MRLRRRRPFPFDALPRGQELRAGDTRPSEPCAQQSGRRVNRRVPLALRQAAGCGLGSERCSSLAPKSEQLARLQASVPVKVPSIVIALMANMAAAVEKLPPRRPVTTTLPPRAKRPVANCSDLSEPTKSQIASNPPPVAPHHRLAARLRIGWIVGLRGAGCERSFFTLLSIDIGDNRRRREKRARRWQGPSCRRRRDR